MNLVPIFVCCVLPVSIVLIVFGTQMFADNKRAAVLIKAIEANKDINADKLAEAPLKTEKDSSGTAEQTPPQRVYFLFCRVRAAYSICRWSCDRRPL